MTKEGGKIRNRVEEVSDANLLGGMLESKKTRGMMKTVLY